MSSVTGPITACKLGSYGMVVLGLIERVQKWRKQMCEKKEETWREPEDYIEHGNLCLQETSPLCGPEAFQTVTVRYQKSFLIFFL